MSETVKPTIAALRAWLKTCPLIADEQEATGAAFRIAGLEEESTAFSIEDSPGDPIITEYISGWEMAKNYLFLSRREYDLMELLMRNGSQIVSKEQLILKVWGYDSAAEDNNVEVYISFLRRKLTHLQSTVKIKTLRMVGYCLEVEA